MIVVERTSLKDKRILVTGGTTGIGRALVHLLIAEGARVLTYGRDQGALDTMLADAPDGPGQATGLVADSSRRSDVEVVFKAVDERAWRHRHARLLRSPGRAADPRDGRG